MVLNVSGTLHADEPEQIADRDQAAKLQFFESKIRPLLVEKCYECHSQSAEKLRGNLLLDSKSGWMVGGDSGEPAIVPGAPESSLLLQTVRHEVPGMEMPPSGDKLTEQQVADLAKWIADGATDPRSGEITERKRADSSWWSLQPIAETFKYSKIDEFIDAKLTESGLKRNSPADPRTLIRRLTYDLHGLPPTVEAVQQFVEDYNRGEDRLSQLLVIERLIDELLNSPRYGEQWGRHWLDVIRFGESIGFERNEIVNNIYPFRDYVISSLNQDKPFNQFIIEHLAGDVIGKDRPEIEIGSAYLVAGPWDDVGNQDPVAAANIRAATLDEIITTTGSAFLGMTVHCARCHHHKFDPIPTEDYYRMRSAFEGVVHGSREVASQQERVNREAKLAPLHAERSRIEKLRSEVQAELDRRVAIEIASQKPTRPKVDSYGTEETFDPVDAKFIRFTVHSTTANNPLVSRSGVGGQLTEFEVWTDEEHSRNIALASLGTKATGAKSVQAEDFADAYGPQHVIDGVLGEAWFIGGPPVLTLELPKVTRINKVKFFNARGSRETTDDSQVRGGTPCEYDIEVSENGTQWSTVATSEGREDWSENHLKARFRRLLITKEEEQALHGYDKQLSEVQAKINAVPGLAHWFVGHRRQPAEPTRVHQAGDPMKPQGNVTSKSLAFLEPVMSGYDLGENAPEALRRLALAQWIARDDNPLTRRVIVNRLWQYHFGTGLVDSSSDFGFLGSKPTHPELLDFLAHRFKQNNWQWKALHKEILLSETYLQSGTPDPAGEEVDKDARLLWRFPPRRLAAEEIRDTMLAVTGQLKLEPMGGPGFRLYRYTQNNVSTYFPLDKVGPETYRRSVYHQNARASVVDILSDFDFPDIAFSAPVRSKTISPMQALTMMNHSFVDDMAAALQNRIQAEVLTSLSARKENAVEEVAAKEVSSESDSVRKETVENEDGSENTKKQVVKSFQLLFQRSPTPQELAIATSFVERFGLHAYCRTLFNTNELIYLE